MSAKTKKVLNIILNVFIWVFVVFSLIITIIAISATASTEGVPSIFGRCILTVQSDSMKPVFQEGDLIIGRQLDREEAANLKVGDVITFYADLNGDGTKEINTHEIIEVSDSNGFVIYSTKGVNNEFKDWYQTYSTDVICQFEGTVIPGLGAFLDFLQSSTGFLVCIVLPLALFFAYELYRFIRTVIEIKGAGKKKITAEDEEEIKRRAVEEYLRQMAEKQAAEKQSETPEEVNPEEPEKPEAPAEEEKPSETGA